jgi:adenine-specific DNA-methyltransferase
MKYAFARQLRREQTHAELRLWRVLRDRGLGQYKFRRQQPIGPYIVDFVCFDAKLIVELDGDRHDQPDAIASDGARTVFLEREGFRVLRFWNGDLDVSIDGVLEAILQALRE